MAEFDMKKSGHKKLPGKPKGQTWKPRGLGEILGFYPKHDPPTAVYGEIQLLRPRRLFIPSVSFNRYGRMMQYSTRVPYENEEPTRPQQSNLHTLLLVGHVLGKNPRFLLNPVVSRFALQVFQVTF